MGADDPQAALGNCAAASSYCDQRGVISSDVKFVGLGSRFGPGLRQVMGSESGTAKKG